MLNEIVSQKFLLIATTKLTKKSSYRKYLSNQVNYENFWISQCSLEVQVTVKNGMVGREAMVAKGLDLSHKNARRSVKSD